MQCWSQSHRYVTYVRALTLLAAGTAGRPLDVQWKHREVWLRGIVLSLHVRRVLHHFFYLLDDLHRGSTSVIKPLWPTHTHIKCLSHIKLLLCIYGSFYSTNICVIACSAVNRGSSARQETMMECMSSCSLSSSSSDSSAVTSVFG